MSGAEIVSVIIPTLNEAAAIEATIRSVRLMPGIAEVIVVDGASVDGTAERAAGAGAKTIIAERGRGAQLAAGAASASGDVLWFLHADTVPPADGAARIVDALRDPAVAAGNFGVRFEGADYGAALLTRLYPHLRRLGLCYGDSAFFVRRAAYEAAGGFRPWPIFEDLDLFGRLRAEGRFVHLDGTVRASGRRWAKRGFVRTFLRWTLLQLLFWAGVPAHRLARLYPQAR